MAVAGIKGEKTLVELAQDFDLHPNQIKQWRDQLLEGANGVFVEAPKGDAEPRIDVKTLDAKIGELTLENDFFARRARQQRSRCEKPCSRESREPNLSGGERRAALSKPCHRIVKGGFVWIFYRGRRALEPRKTDVGTDTREIAGLGAHSSCRGSWGATWIDVGAGKHEGNVRGQV